jgi:hypothetical protein
MLKTIASEKETRKKPTWPASYCGRQVIVIERNWRGAAPAHTVSAPAPHGQNVYGDAFAPILELHAVHIARRSGGLL